MTSPETSVADVAQKTLHDQIRELAETVYEQSGVKLQNVELRWDGRLGIPSRIMDIEIETTKGL